MQNNEQQDPLDPILLILGDWKRTGEDKIREVKLSEHGISATSVNTDAIPNTDEVDTVFITNDKGRLGLVVLDAATRKSGADPAVFFNNIDINFANDFLAKNYKFWKCMHFPCCTNLNRKEKRELKQAVDRKK